MPSSKERLRWERWYDRLTARMERQKRSITRLVIMNTETTAALARIEQDPEVRTIKQARAIAKMAMERVQESATAEGEDSEDIAEPLPDPRSNHG